MYCYLGKSSHQTIADILSKGQNDNKNDHYAKITEEVSRKSGRGDAVNNRTDNRICPGLTEGTDNQSKESDKEHSLVVFEIAE